MTKKQLTLLVSMFLCLPLLGTYTLPRYRPFVSSLGLRPLPFDLKNMMPADEATKSKQVEAVSQKLDRRHRFKATNGNTYVETEPGSNVYKRDLFFRAESAVLSRK